jgi:ABC-type uncharacterized transport system involved in gliding motility auxiliary subunit
MKAPKIGRSILYGTNLFVAVSIVLGIIILVGLISERHTKRFDLTATKRFSLSEQSIKILKSLPVEVNVISFYKKNQPGERSAKDILEQYAYHSGNFKHEFLDPDRNPIKAKQYEVTSYGTIIVESGQRHEKVYDAKEETITNAILKVTRTTAPIVYFLKGHGEGEISNSEDDGYSSAKKAVEGEAYQSKELLLMREESVPADCSALVVAGPRKELFKSEIEAIDTYVRNGGSVLFMIDPDTLSEELVKLLDRYGVSVGDDIVVDRTSRMFGGDYLMPLVMQYEYHDITKDFDIATLFPLARSVDVKQSPGEGISASVIAKTGPGSWAETDKAMLKDGKAGFDEGKDKKGPVGIGAAASIKVNKPGGDSQTSEASQSPSEGRIVVYGSCGFVKNAYIDLSGNRDLYLNTINWLVHEANLISIRPREPENTPVMLTPRQMATVFIVPVVVVPLVVIGAGTAICIKRRWNR